MPRSAMLSVQRFSEAANLVPPGQTAETPRARVAPGHLLALDGVRGLAILMVVCSHSFQANYESRTGAISLIGNLLRYGIFGVDLFFVLSGFLITGILYDSLHDSGYFRKFYIRRALRIFPLYYGVLIVCLLLTHPLHLHWGNMGWLLIFYLQNLHPKEIMSFSPGGDISLYHFWSLAIEEQFYLVWPAVLYLVRDRRRLLVITLAGSAAAFLLRIVILVASGSAFAIHATTICRADSLLLGGTLAMLYRTRIWSRVACLASRSFAITAGITVVTLILFTRFTVHPPLGDEMWRVTMGYSLLALTFVSLIAWALAEGSLCQQFFTLPGLRFLGKYSYGLYVLHIFVLDALLLPLRNLLTQLTHSKLLAVAGSGILSIVVAVLSAWISYHAYEKRFLILKRYYAYSPRLKAVIPSPAISPVSGLGASNARQPHAFDQSPQYANR